METRNFESRNEKTLREAIEQFGDFDFIDNQVDSKGKAHTFIRLGVKVAYPSKNAQEVLRAKGAGALNELKYAEMFAQEMVGKIMSNGKVSDGWINCVLMNNGGLKSSVHISRSEL